MGTCSSAYTNIIENHELFNSCKLLVENNLKGVLSTNRAVATSVAGVDRLTELTIHLSYLHNNFTLTHILGSDTPEVIYKYIRDNKLEDLIFRIYSNMRASLLEDTLTLRLLNHLASSITEVRGLTIDTVEHSANSLLDKSLRSEMASWTESVNVMYSNPWIVVIIIMQFISTDYLMEYSND